MAAITNFHRNRSCSKCPLHEGARNVCVPSRPLVLSQNRTQALYILGEAPGVKEDHEDKCFVGKAGHYLSHIYISGMGLDKHADVYAGNAIRCIPPMGSKPNLTHIRACYEYTRRDLSHLISAYKGRVTVLCVGATATRALLNKSVTDAFRVQGQLLEIPYFIGDTIESAKIPVYSTYHPALLFSGRNPSAAPAVEDHLNLLISRLKGDIPTPETLPLTKVMFGPTPRTYEISHLALDIETYGAVKGTPQRYFHPKKSQHLDGVPLYQQILTVSLAWKLIYRSKPYYAAAVFLWKNAQHRFLLTQWLNKCRDDQTVLVGANLAFDLTYLRSSFAFATVLQRRRLLVEDIQVLAYLHNPERPERSLKALAQLYGLPPYEHTIGSTGGFDSASDPRLWQYNCMDAVLTLRLRDLLREKIRDSYGKYPNTWKNTRQSTKWYSDLIWLAVHMSEAGAKFSLPRLRRLRKLTRHALTALDAKASMGLSLPGPLSGPGSQKYLNDRFQKIARTLPLNIQRNLNRTDTHRRISTDRSNREAMLAVLPPSSEDARFLRTLESYNRHRKLLTSYLDPLLKRFIHRKPSKSVLVDGTAYPTIYIVPSTTKDEDESSEGYGGTKQSRFAFRHPPLQTNPEPVFRCLTTRFRPGVLLYWDLSQIELRIAALLSQDPHMLQEFKEGLDKHHVTACVCFGTAIAEGPNREYYRKVAKRINFKTLYRGGPDDLISAYMLQAFWSRYGVLRNWQDSLIETAVNQGHLEVPHTGQSRTFSGSRQTVLDTYVPTIVNFPIQAVASNLLQSIQIDLLDYIQRNRLRAVMPLQIHDAVLVDCPSSERPGIEVAFSPEDTPYWRNLIRPYTLAPPLKWQAKVLARRK